MSACNHDLSTPIFHNIGDKIKAKFAFVSFLWQASVIVDLIYQIKNVFIIAGINAKKRLIYQKILKVTGGIVLIISPTIAFIKDQQ